ncbi:MAG TPA: DUF4178 domain-containing protein [Bacilli bacterium]|nr:DUF4178 domain-containing protein [Bacilli bacterium]
MSFFKRIKTIWQATRSDGRSEPEDRNLTNLQVGDILTVDLVDYKLEGVTVYRSGGKVRRGYLLVDGTDTRYLLVEQKEKLRAYLFENLDARLENPDEINTEMIFDDVSYFETAKGESSVEIKGRSAFVPYDPVYWWLHLSDKGEALLTEWQNGETVLRRGMPVQPYEVTILPGSE